MTTVILTFSGCASEDFVGNKELHEANENGRPVSFGIVAAPQTRAVYGGEAADLLNNNFVVWGDKTVNSATQTVFDNYQVNYVTNTASTTTTNSAGWEYVGYKNLPYGTTTTSGGTLNNNGVAVNATASGVDQTIKFWDYGASSYNFFAYSLGKGVEVTPATDPKTYTYATTTAMNTGGYSLSGSVDELSACYISDKAIIPHASLSSTNTQVSLQFRRLGAKVKVALYETIPGYSVKNVRFYRDDNVASGAEDGYGYTAYLYAADGATKFNRGGGKFDITFTDAVPTLGWTGNNTDLSYISFGDAVTTSGTTWTGWQGKEYKETAENVYIGRSLTQATGPKDFVTVLPYPEGTTLSLKVDFTLLSRDDSQEVIEVTGAKATVPAQFAAWKPNCSYTYIFKISDDTPGQTAPGDPTKPSGLYPITLDAVVNVAADGTQETITTVTEPEPTITTYQKGSDYATVDGYDATNGDIYVTVMDGLNVQPLIVSGEDVNAKLFTATVEEGAAQGITEITVANAIENGTYDSTTGTWTLTDGSTGESLIVTAAAENSLTEFSEIPGTATPDGNPIAIDGAKFTPTAGTTYVFQFRKCEYTPVTGLTEGTSPVKGYYTRTESEGLYLYTKITDEAAKAETDVTYYSYGLATPEKYQYKVIKVKE